MGMVSFLAFLGLVVWLCTAGNRRVEKALPIVFSLWMIVGTGFAMANALPATDWLAGVILIALAVWLAVSLIRRRGGVLWERLRRNFLTPGLLGFSLLAVGFYIVTQPMVVWWADDVFYWALEPKGLWYLGGLTDSLGSIVYGFSTYTPGMQVMQWQMMRFFGRFDEGLLYYALFLTYGLYLLPLTEGISWRRLWTVPLWALGLVLLPLMSNALAYTFLCADTALAACFAFVLLTLRDDKPDPLALAAGLCGLVLLKQSGILLCGYAALFAWLYRPAAKRQAIQPLKSRTLWLCWLAPVLTLGAWLLFCVLKPMEGAHDVHTFDSLLAMFNGQFTMPQQWSVMPGSFLYALMHWPSTERLLTALPLLPVPMLGWIALFTVFPLLLSRTLGRGRMIRFSLLALGGSALYLLATLGSFMTTFNSEIASYTGENINNLTLLLERYLSPLLLGLGALEVSLAREAWRQPYARAGFRVGLSAVFAGLLIFTVNWGSLGDTLIPAGYLSREDTVSVAEQTEETNFWAEDFNQRANAVVMTGFSNDAEFIGNLGYAFAPARFVLPLRMRGDLEALTDDLRNRGVTHLVCLDDANELYELASELSPDGYLDTYTLYRVVDDGTDITLEIEE